MKSSDESTVQVPGLCPWLRPYLDPISVLLGANGFSTEKWDPFWESKKQQIVQYVVLSHLPFTTCSKQSLGWFHIMTPVGGNKKLSVDQTRSF